MCPGITKAVSGGQIIEESKIEVNNDEGSDGGESDSSSENEKNQSDEDKDSIDDSNMPTKNNGI